MQVFAFRRNLRADLVWIYLFGVFYDFICFVSCTYVSRCMSTREHFILFVFNFLEVVHHCVTTMFFRFCIYAPRFRSGRAHLFWGSSWCFGSFWVFLFWGECFYQCGYHIPFCCFVGSLAMTCHRPIWFSQRNCSLVHSFGLNKIYSTLYSFNTAVHGPSY